MINPVKYISGIVLLTLAAAPYIANAQTPAGDKAWIAKSNSYTKMLLDITKKHNPEFGSSQGLAEYDTLISVPTLANEQAERKEDEQAVEMLKSSKQTETNSAVKQDIDILIRQEQLGFRTQDLGRKREVPFINATEIVYEGLQTLLDDQTPVERRKAAVIRISKYAGVDKAYKPITAILISREQEQLVKPDMIYPSKQQMEVQLSRNASIVDGIEELFKKYQQTGWEQSFALLKKQLQDYDAWVKANILPKARTDYRLPPEEYKLALEGFGIDIPPADLAKMAHDTFTNLQNQMKPLAAQLAKKYRLPSSDYRDVIKYLKQQQITGDSILPVFKSHLTDIEKIIAGRHIVTLPNRPAIIRLATAAETAQTPAPHMVPPPFLNNTGERGVFVLPLNSPTAVGEKEDKYDDFTFDAATWTMIAHEARPGHELQFDKMVEEGISQARALYAFNSTNVEGWGLYSEYLILPYMPAEGQLMSLNFRMLRAARAFLDPELQAGTITQDQAYKVLMNDVLLSHAFAKEEVERYTIQMPGQANSYFYGYTKMIALRKDTEKALGAKFNQQHFHDFILSQGLLPPALLREAVMNDLVTQENK